MNFFFETGYAGTVPARVFEGFLGVLEVAYSRFNNSNDTDGAGQPSIKAKSL